MEKMDLCDEEFKKAFLKALPPEKYLKMKNFKYLTEDTKYLLVLLKVLDKLDEAVESDCQKPFNFTNKKSNLDIMCCTKTDERKDSFKLDDRPPECDKPHSKHDRTRDASVSNNDLQVHVASKDQRGMPRCTGTTRSLKITMPSNISGCFRKIAVDDISTTSSHRQCRSEKKKPSSKRSSDGSKKKKKGSKNICSSSQSSAQKSCSEESSHTLSEKCVKKPKSKSEKKECLATCKKTCSIPKGDKKAKRALDCSGYYEIKKMDPSGTEYEFTETKAGVGRTESIYELDLKCMKKAYKQETKMCKKEIKQRKKCEKLEKKRLKQVEAFKKKKDKMACKLEKKYKRILGEKYDEIIADDCRGIGAHT